MGATAHLPGGEYTASVFHQVSRWLLVLAMASSFLAATVWLLDRKDTSALARP